ncbi:MAG: Hsp20/alpha crystallin family protein [Thermodesulfobacteriota bacterium]
MAIVRMNPFHGIIDMRRLDSLVDEFLGQPLAEINGGFWYPAIDISEDENNIFVTAEIPGMDKENVTIRLLENVLTIGGEKKKETEHKGINLHRVERSYGAFRRSVTLPFSAQSDKVKAVYKDGLLKITLPKTEKAKAKEISIALEGK